MVRTLVCAGLVASAGAFNAPTHFGAGRAAVRTASSPLFMQEVDAAADSLEKEFESVKAATVAAELMAPTVEKMSVRRRKRDVFVGAWRKGKALVGLKKDLEQAASDLVGDECEIDKPEVCEEDEKEVRGMMSKVMRLFVGGKATSAELDEIEATTAGDSMEEGWTKKASGSATKRTLEVWGFLAKCGLKVVKAGKTKGTDEEVSAAKTAAAEFIRDGLFRLGPTFVKFGQVISTRTDVVEKEYAEASSAPLSLYAAALSLSLADL